MVDLIRAGLDELERVHAGRNVSRHRHPQPVRLVRDHAHQRRRDGLVDLDLLEPGVLVAPHHRARLVGRTRELHAEAIRRAVDQAREEQSRPERATVLDRIPQAHGELELVADIPRGGNPRRELCGRPFDLLEMHVHVPQTGDHGPTARDHDGHSRRDRDRAARAGSRDASVANHDHSVGGWRRTGSVNQPRSGNGVVALVDRSHGARLYGQIREAIPHRAAHEGGQVTLEPLAHSLEAIQLSIAVDDRDEASIVRRPERLPAP